MKPTRVGRQDFIDCAKDYVVNTSDLTGILFSQRKKLAEKYYKWLDEPGRDFKIKDCPESVIAFLDILGLLKTQPVVETKIDHTIDKKNVDFLENTL